jgi:hypothetical protein
MTLGDQPRVVEHVERHLEGGPGDLHVRRPAAELLVVGDGRGEHAAIDVREERGLRLRHVGSASGEEPGARFPVSAREALGRVGAEPFARGGQAREGAGADGLADGRHHVADLVVLELLRRRPLLVDVVALALAKRRVHLVARHLQRLHGLEVEAAPVTGVLEHGEGLAAVVHEHLLAGELLPREDGIGGAAREEEAVLFVDLGEVNRRRLLPFLERAEALGRRGLAYVHGAVHDALDGRLARGRHGVPRLETFVLEESARDGGDQRRVEGGEAGELYADRVAHEYLLAGGGAMGA